MTTLNTSLLSEQFTQGTEAAAAPAVPTTVQGALPLHHSRISNLTREGFTFLVTKMANKILMAQPLEVTRPRNPKLPFMPIKWTITIGDEKIFKGTEATVAKKLHNLAKDGYAISMTLDHRLVSQWNARSCL